MLLSFVTSYPPSCPVHRVWKLNSKHSILDFFSPVLTFSLCAGHPHPYHTHTPYAPVILTYFQLPKHNILYQAPTHTWNAFSSLCQPGELQSVLKLSSGVVASWLTPGKVSCPSLGASELLYILPLLHTLVCLPVSSQQWKPIWE